MSDAGKIPELKASPEWQAEQWTKWRRVEDWPAVLDVYEAAAFLRVNPWTLRRGPLQPDRKNRAALAHQRIGPLYRIRRADLENFGAVKARASA